MWYEITYAFPNFIGCTVEVREWLSKFIPHFIIGAKWLSMLVSKLDHVYISWWNILYYHMKLPTDQPVTRPPCPCGVSCFVSTWPLRSNTYSLWDEHAASAAPFYKLKLKNRWLNGEILKKHEWSHAQGIIMGCNYLPYFNCGFITQMLIFGHGCIITS